MSTGSEQNKVHRLMLTRALYKICVPRTNLSKNIVIIVRLSYACLSLDGGSPTYIFSSFTGIVYQILQFVVIKLNWQYSDRRLSAGALHQRENCWFMRWLVASISSLASCSSCVIQMVKIRQQTFHVPLNNVRKTIYVPFISNNTYPRAMARSVMANSRTSLG